MKKNTFKSLFLTTLFCTINNVKTMENEAQIAEKNNVINTILNTYKDNERVLLTMLIQYKDNIKGTVTNINTNLPQNDIIKLCKEYLGKLY